MYLTAPEPNRQAGHQPYSVLKSHMYILNQSTSWLVADLGIVWCSGWDYVPNNIVILVIIWEHE